MVVDMMMKRKKDRNILCSLSLQYVGRILDLAPSSPQSDARALALILSVGDFHLAFSKSLSSQQPAMGNKAVQVADPSVKFQTETIPRYLEAYRNKIGSNEFFIDNSVSICCFSFTMILCFRNLIALGEHK